MKMREMESIWVTSIISSNVELSLNCGSVLAAAVATVALTPPRAAGLVKKISSAPVSSISASRA